MNIEELLQQLLERKTDMRFNNVEINPNTIRAIMINEVVPSCPEDDFYGKPDAASGLCVDWLDLRFEPIRNDF